MWKSYGMGRVEALPPHHGTVGTQPLLLRLTLTPAYGTRPEPDPSPASPSSAAPAQTGDRPRPDTAGHK
jgi:hypothetical protein